jgi:hypothetical protein
MDNATRLPNYMLFRKPRTRTTRALNNVFVVTEIARRAVAEARKTYRVTPPSQLNFSIPTVRGEEIVVARRRNKILSLLDQALDRDFFAQGLVSAVAITESYLGEMLSLILRAFPGKLGTPEGKVDLRMIVAAKSLDNLIEAIATKEIQTTFYASPSRYFENIEHTLSISIENKDKLSFAEIKATRDVFVHNGGIANRLYLQKADRLARAAEGRLLPMDDEYFSRSISLMKRIVRSVNEQLLRKYGKARELGRR